MNSEQLNSARMARWSQNGEARLTLEAASEWLGGIGFCCYLPTGSGSPPSASFLEAVVGRPARIPSAGERTRAHELLARMVENSAAVPLKLGASITEPPDVVSSPELLRYVYALRGSRNFKADPSTVGNERITPLGLHCWQSIREHGPLDLAVLQSILGRDMTEAALARALHELWAAMYICPLPKVNGEPGRWELLSRKFPQQVAAGANTGHAEALSAFVSSYLHSVIAATEDEILAFLSPLAPQSKLRELVRGLSSMRQLDLIDIGGRAHLCLQGGLLPEMVAVLSEEQLTAAAEITAGDEQIRTERDSQRPFRHGTDAEPGKRGKFVPKKFVPRKFATGDARPRDAAPRRFGMDASGGSKPGAPHFSRPASNANSPTHQLRPGYGKRDARDSEDRGRQKPWNQQKSFRSGTPKKYGAEEEPPRPWRKSGPGAGKKPRSGGPYSDKSWVSRGAARAERRGSDDHPRRWEGPDESRSKDIYNRPFSAKSSNSKTTGFKSGGAKPSVKKTARQGPDQRDGQERPRRWERSGSSAGPKPSGGRPYRSKSSGSSGSTSQGAKPWGRRPRFEKSSAVDRPRRRENDSQRPEERSAGNSGRKSESKPFWAKERRGGKGPATASRSNGPRSGKSGGNRAGKNK